jgi:hypothetical protein
MKYIDVLIKFAKPISAASAIVYIGLSVTGGSDEHLQISVFLDKTACK